MGLDVFVIVDVIGENSGFFLKGTFVIDFRGKDGNERRRERGR